MRDQYLAHDAPAAALSQHDEANWLEVNDERNLANAGLASHRGHRVNRSREYGLSTNEYRGGSAPNRVRRDVWG
jgi:hypothetical protein